MFGFEFATKNSFTKIFNGQEITVEFTENCEYIINHPLRDSRDVQHYKRVKQWAQSIQRKAQVK